MTIPGSDTAAHDIFTLLFSGKHIVGTTSGCATGSGLNSEEEEEEEEEEEKEEDFLNFGSAKQSEGQVTLFLLLMAKGRKMPICMRTS